MANTWKRVKKSISFHRIIYDKNQCIRISGTFYLCPRPLTILLIYDNDIIIYTRGLNR